MNPKQKIGVLLVDDHLAVRLGLTTILNDQPDMQVIAEAANGMAALELYAKKKPDVVLLDLRFPGMSGVEIIKEMHARFGKPRILVLTTLDREEDIYRSLEAGAKGYVLKDMRKEDLDRGDPRGVRRRQLDVARGLTAPGAARGPPGAHRA